MTTTHKNPGNGVSVQIFQNFMNGVSENAGINRLGDIRGQSLGLIVYAGRKGQQGPSSLFSVYRQAPGAVECVVQSRIVVGLEWTGPWI
jgi:hypothetical protein